MRSSVIGCEEQQVVAFSHLFVQLIEQFAQLLIQVEVYRIGLFTSHTVFVTHIVGRRKAHGQEVGFIALPQFFVVQNLHGQAH